MSSEKVSYELNTIKGHGLAVGDRFHFYGMGSDTIPTAEGTRVELGKVGNKYIITTVSGDVHTWEFGPSAKIFADTTVKHDITTATRTLDNGDTVYTATCEHGWMTGFHNSAEDAYAVAEGHGEVSRPLYVTPDVKVPGKPQWSAMDQADMDGQHVTILGRAIINGAWEYEVRDFSGNAHSPRSYVPSDALKPYVHVAPVADITGAEVEAARVAVRDNGRVFAAEVHNFGGQAAFDVLVESGTHMLIDDGDMSRYVRTIRTADGAVIADGMAVWDYNLNPGHISLCSVDRDGWFFVDTINGGSLMNGERVRTVHPVTGQTARAAIEGPSLGAIADSMAETDARHTAALAAEVPPIGTRVMLTRTSEVGMVEARYSDGRANVVDSHGVSMGVVDGRDMVKLPTVKIHTTDGTVITEDDVKARVRQAFGTKITESEVWAGTGTMIKRPIRTKLGRRKRKASKVNARRVRGGF